MKKKYIKVPFINRKDEKKYVLDYLNNSEPASILFMYWPKSSGKTTLLNKVTDELPKDYLVSYINFRWYIIANYENFIEILFDETNSKKSDIKTMVDKTIEIFKEKKDSYSRESKLDLWFVKCTTQIKKDFYERRKDPFHYIENVYKEIKAKWYKPVLIFDEIQELKDIYMNGDKMKKALLMEMFAFFIRLTKELHLAHVICMTSESTFVDEIYNHVKLKNTSDFYMLKHLKKEDVYKWLEWEKLEKKEIDRIWRNLWGSPQEIWMVLVKYKNWMKLKDAVDERIQVEVGRIRDYIILNSENVFEKKEIRTILDTSNIIIKKWKFLQTPKKYVEFKLISKLVMKDIWFYDSITWEITANSESVRQAFKKIQKMIK